MAQEFKPGEIVPQSGIRRSRTIPRLLVTPALGARSALSVAED
jgi:hypothetical protein